ncbi:TIGR00282 family metallophosphoesterase [Candidatus Dependentiae bacterium]
MSKALKILFFGDVVGISGQAVFQKWAIKLKKKFKADMIAVNGENSAKNGKGISSKIMEFFRHCDVNVVTSGNHIWQNKEIYLYLDEHTDLIRPANYPSSCPGKGYSLFEINGFTIGVINLQGRIFMRENLDCPFKAAESILTFLKTRTNIIFVDFHAEATSEKIVLASFLDGQVSGVFGTHTHVQTADEKILPNGTAFISDIGFCGSSYSAIGIKIDAVLKRFLTQMPSRFSVETNPPFTLNGIFVEVDTSTGKAIKIERICIVDKELHGCA